MVAIQQHFVLGKTRYPFSPLSSLFIAQGEEVVTTDHITIILCPLEQRYTLISYLMNVPLRIFTSISLHIKYVQLNKTCAHV